MAEETATERPGNSEHRQRRLWESGLARWTLFLALLFSFTYGYLWIGKALLEQTNNTAEDMRGGDQAHNMRLATDAHADLNPDFRKGFLAPLNHWFPHRTDGVVNPLWPWMAAWLVREGHTVSEDMVSRKVEPSEDDWSLFHRGRLALLFLGTGFLFMLGIAAARIFSVPAACNLLLLGGFGALLPRSAYFQPEPVYFIFFFLTWVACVSALNHNSLWIYALIGVLSGLAYLAKGSIQPLLGIFVLVSSFRCVWEFFSAQRRGFVMGSTHLWHWRNHLVGIVFLAITHLMTIGPRLSESYEKYGDMFHSYPSYWMWLDKFNPDCYQWMADHNTKEELVNLRPEDKPSLGQYLRTHGHQEALDRLWNGVWDKVGEFLWPDQTKRAKKNKEQKGWRGILEWRGVYLGWLFLVLIALLVVLNTAAPKALHAGHMVFHHGTVVTVLFAVGSFVAYALLYGWYSPIARGSGDRFMLSLYLPLAFTLIWAAETIIRRLRRRQVNPWILRGYLIAQWLLFFAICWRISEIVSHPVFYHKGS